MTTRLTSAAPVLHRAAHRLAVAGVRGAGCYWWLAERAVALPEWALVEVGSSGDVEVIPGDSGERRLYRGLHEREERAVVRRLVRPGETCVDVGANVGSYTLLLASHTGPSGSVVAIEPATAVRHRLQEAVEAMPWVTVLSFGLSDSDGRAVLSEEPGHAGRSTLRPTGGSCFTKVSVEVRRLDGLDVLAGSDVDFLKIDVEGWEGTVLAGAGDLIADARVGALMLEASPEFGTLDYLRALFRHGSYTAWVIRAVHSRSHLRIRPQLVPVGRPEDIASQCNILFVRQDRVARLAGLVVG